ncbi:hypothetical protein IJV57_02175 [Candidatus Saccharibacteria bacterium]|nr:hypothetical protein [Candidatus Saccharibacteria bacterium]
MDKKLWFGAVAFVMIFCASVSSITFAEEARTNCIGDSSGKTNCMVDVVDEGLVDRPHISLDTTELSYGQITEAGRSYTKSLVIENAASQKVTMRIEAAEYESDSLSDEQKAVVDWIAFVGGKRKFDVNPGAKIQVGVRLMVPTDAKGGTYYARVKVSNGDENDTQYVKIRADVVNEDYKYDGKVTSQNIGFFNFGERIGASAKVKNGGTAGFSSHYIVQYKNAFGLDEWKQVAEEMRDVVPGAEESFTITDETRAKIGYGVYTVEQRISYIDAEGKQKESILSHAVVNLPWWGLAIVVGVVVLIIVMIIVIKIHHKKGKKTAKKTKKKSVDDEPKDDEL